MVENVILLHGAGRSPRSMGCMAKALEREGYQAHNLGYPSRQMAIEGLAAHIGAQIHQIQPHSSAKLHFVTHSLGGIVLRYLLKYDRPSNLGRVVMLAPPNRGAELADLLGRLPFYDWILGPVGAQLGTGSDSLPNTLGPVDYETGIIAGNRSLNIITSWLIPGPDDGKVSVERARLEGVAHFLVVPATHTFIMNRRDVAEQTAHFLRNGRFSADSLAAREADSVGLTP